MKKTLSLRTQLFSLMALLVLLQSLALALALSISEVFTALDAEAFRLFDNTTDSRVQMINDNVGRVVGNVSKETEKLALSLRDLAEDNDYPVGLFYQDNAMYESAAVYCAESLLSILQNNNVTGAYVVFAGSNSSKDDPGAHSALYIRNSAPNISTGDTSNYLMEIGPIAISRQLRIATSVNWDLDLSFSSASDEARRFYDMPIWASTEAKRMDLSWYGYWSFSGAILGDERQVVCYSLPLLDRNGDAYGVVGIEISLAHFTQDYLPNTDLPYQNSFYAIAPVKDGAADLSWFIPSGPMAQVYLDEDQLLPLTAVGSSNLFSTVVPVFGDAYCSIQTLSMYSRTSPFHEDGWTLIGFVPKDILHETSSGARLTLTSSIILTTFVSFLAISVLTYASTRKISGLSEYVRGLSPSKEIKFIRTGMREIDELTAAVEMLNKSVVNASKTTSKILELSLMPMGGFEFMVDSPYATVTEYVYTLLRIPPGTPITKQEWAELYSEMTARPAAEYENVYQFTDPQTGEVKWLRIVEAYSDTGCVGIIFDASGDIEEHRRLAHELDFDSLTHLYSRVAFKREAHQRILDEPNKIGALIFADLDNLKYINDTFGHDIGDRLIIRAGEMFQQFVKYGGVVSRISGDEFAIYLHGFSSKGEARKLIDRQYEANDSYTLPTPDGAQHRIRSSSGIAWYPDDSDNVTDLLKLADFAMYEAKHSRKGAVLEFNRASYLDKAYLLENREAINRLLDEELIRFAYQPIISLKTGEVFGYEFLMRPLLENFNSPMEILSVAAAQSKLGPLERLVLFKAFQTIADHQSLLAGKKVFVNSIPSQSLTNEDEHLLWERYSGVFDHVVIEITEAETQSAHQLDSKIHFIKDNGMLIALDDFGAGYSNEVRILSMNPDIVKIDREMIQNIHNDADKQHLVANIHSFCSSKNIPLIAEGVEEYDELAALIRLGVDFVQGYYTGRPDFYFKDTPKDIKKQILGLQPKE